MNEDVVTALFGLSEDIYNLQLPNSYLLKYYQDLSERVIWIDGDVDSDTVYELLHYIIKWNKEDQFLEPEYRPSIHLMFNSPGGSLDAYNSICNIIELSKTPIIGVAVGMVASAASLIFLSCHQRLALSSSYFILHKGSAQLNGDFDNIMSSIDDYKKEIDKMVDFYSKHSSYTREEIESHISKDWYVRAQEAYEHGFVDKIIEDIDDLF